MAVRKTYQHVDIQPTYTVGHATADSFMIKIPGIPVPQGSKRHVGKGQMKESSDFLKAWRATVSAAVRFTTSGFAPYPVARVHAIFLMPRPKSHLNAAGDVKPAFEDAWCTAHNLGDVDKLLRACFDALTDAGAITDDSAIVELGRVKKMYTKPRLSGPTWSTPGAVLEVKNLAPTGPAVTARASAVEVAPV